MAQLYDRSYSLLIGPLGQTGILVENLKVEFHIEKTLEPQPNVCTIKITNLSEKSRSLIEEKRTAVILNAGYGKEIKNIFVGDIGKVTTEKVGTDIISTIEAGDGQTAYIDAKLDISFAPGTKFGQAFDAVKAKLGISEGQVKGLNLNDQFGNGLALSGPVRDHLNMLTKRQRLEWSIQNNQLQILPVDEATDEQAVVLNSETGLIGNPFKTKVLNDSLLKKKDGKIVESGVKCVSLLNAEIKPGRRIALESKLVTGVFKVTKVTYTGDNYANPWFCEIEAK